MAAQKFTSLPKTQPEQVVFEATGSHSSRERYNQSYGIHFHRLPDRLVPQKLYTNLPVVISAKPFSSCRRSGIIFITECLNLKIPDETSSLYNRGR